MSAFCDASKCSVRLIPCKNKIMVLRALLLATVLQLSGAMEQITLEEAKDAFKNCGIRQLFDRNGRYPVMCSFNLFNACPTQSFGLEESLTGDFQLVLRCQIEPYQNRKCPGTLMSVRQSNTPDTEQEICVNNKETIGLYGKSSSQFTK